MNFESPWNNLPTVPFENWSGETIPTFGIFAVSAGVYDNGVLFLKAVKPSTTFYWDYAVNNMFPVPSANGTKKGRGSCYVSGPVRVAYDTGTPVALDTYGWKQGQFTVTKNGVGDIRCLTPYDTTNKFMFAMLQPIYTLIGKLAEAYSYNEQDIDVDLWYGTAASPADSTVNLNSNDWLMKSGATNIASGKKVLMQRINGVNYISEAECN